MKGEVAVLGLAFAWCWTLGAYSFFVFEEIQKLFDYLLH
jgi:hypothetical protein